MYTIFHCICLCLRYGTFVPKIDVFNVFLNVSIRRLILNVEFLFKL